MHSSLLTLMFILIQGMMQFYALTRFLLNLFSISSTDEFNDVQEHPTEILRNSHFLKVLNGLKVTTDGIVVDYIPDMGCNGGHDNPSKSRISVNGENDIFCFHRALPTHLVNITENLLNIACKVIPDSFVQRLQQLFEIISITALVNFQNCPCDRYGHEVNPHEMDFKQGTAFQVYG